MLNPLIIKLSALATIGVALSACATEPKSDAAPTAKRAGNECVFFSALYDWQALDDSNLVVWVPGKNDAYQVALTMPLMGLKFANTLGFIDGTQDGRLCSYGRDAITVADNLGGDSMSQRSTIRSIARLNSNTLVQLEEKYKVKLRRESKRKAPPKTPDRETAL